MTAIRASAILQHHGAALLPRGEDGLGIGALMALLVHMLLILALAVGVNWHASEPAGISAELWAAVPQIAAPSVAQPPAEPPPAPPQQKEEAPLPQQAEREAEMAIEKAKREKQKARELEEERQRQEREKALKEKAEKDKLAKAKAQAEANKRKREEDDARLAKLRAENLQRLMGQVGASGPPTSSGTAARNAGPSATYAGRIISRIHPNIVFTESINALSNHLRAEVELRVAPDGTIIGRHITQPSGIKEWDDAVLRAIDRTGVLPRDIDGRVPPSIVIGFRPKDAAKP